MGHLSTDLTHALRPPGELWGMDERDLPVRRCRKCHGLMSEGRDKRSIYCSVSCKDVAMKRRRRGVPVEDPVAASDALALAVRVAGMEETARQAAHGAIRARESRDRYKAKVRSLEAVVATERRRAADVVREQAAKTAAMRDELAMLRRGLVAVREQLATKVAVPAGSADVDGEGRLRSRLAEGNAAYGKLMETHQQLRSAFDQLSAQSTAMPGILRAWDRLCSRLYQSTKGRPSTEAEQQVLSQWITWRNAQTKKAGNT